MTELNARQRRFVEHYALTLNAREAAESAGYSMKTAGAIGAIMARRFAERPEIVAARRERVEQFALPLAVMLKGLMREAQGEAGRPSSAGRLAAWEKLGRYLGVFGRKRRG